MAGRATEGEIRVLVTPAVVDSTVAGRATEGEIRVLVTPTPEVNTKDGKLVDAEMSGAPIDTAVDNEGVNPAADAPMRGAVTEALTTYENWLPAPPADVPSPVVTTTFWFDPEPLGTTQVNDVLETTVTLVAAAPTTVTPVVPLKSVPVKVIVVPAGPLDGETFVTVGTA